jgi:glycosyltransferase involved in cell wall biosynthesis
MCLPADPPPVKIAFYCPLKPMSSPVLSGDREIARGLHSFLVSRGASVFVLSEFHAWHFYQRPAGWLVWLRDLFRAYRKARREDPDLFFTYHLYYHAPDPIGFLLAWWFGKPHFIFEGRYSRRPSAGWLRHWPGVLLTRGALSRAEGIFAITTVDYDGLRKWFPEQKLWNFPPSIDLALFSRGDSEARVATRAALGAADGDVLIMTVAMLREGHKTEGVLFLLRCLGRLAQEGHAFRWVHIGDGECRAKVEEEARRILGNRATLLGSQELAAVARLLQAGDIFAFPGLHEAFGLAYVEAQAAGLPVVAFRNNGIPDAVDDGGSAFLTPVLDENAYTEALRRLLVDPGLRAQMSLRAIAFAREKFDRASNYGKLWDALVEAVKEKRPGA